MLPPIMTAFLVRVVGDVVDRDSYPNPSVAHTKFKPDSCLPALRSSANIRWVSPPLSHLILTYRVLDPGSRGTTSSAWEG